MTLLNANDLKVIDLKKDGFFVPAYVKLRNLHATALLTKSVSVVEMIRCLIQENVEVRCVINDPELLGATILYPDKDGEVALFAKVQGQGIGSLLLETIEGVAVEQHLSEVWAWVSESNAAAQKAFLKNGYVESHGFEKEYQVKTISGVIFVKKLLIPVPAPNEIPG